MDTQKLTKKQAAKLLGCSTKTVDRHITRGALSKHLEGTRVFVLLSEVLTLRETPVQDKPRAVQNSLDTLSNPQVSTVLVERSHYDALLVRLGQLESEVARLESENQKLIEDTRPWWKRIFR